MLDALLTEIDLLLSGIEQRYYKLILVVGSSGSGKTAFFQLLEDRYRVSSINLNLSFSRKFIELTQKQRRRQFPSLMHSLIKEQQKLLLIDNTEILFDISLNQDPLRLLQSISRNSVVIATWNGSFVGQKLKYAETGHPEFRSYDSADALMMRLDGASTANSAIYFGEAGQA